MGYETSKEEPRLEAGPGNEGVSADYDAATEESAAGVSYSSEGMLSSPGDVEDPGEAEGSPRGLGGAYIPAHVLFARGLSPRAKLLFGRIMGLDSGDRGCYAGNEFLARSLDIEPETVTRLLYELMKRGFITREFVRVGNHTERRLYPAGFPQGTGTVPSTTGDRMPHPGPEKGSADGNGSQGNVGRMPHPGTQGQSEGGRMGHPGGQDQSEDRNGSLGDGTRMPHPGRMPDPGPAETLLDLERITAKVGADGSSGGGRMGHPGGAGWVIRAEVIDIDKRRERSKAKVYGDKGGRGEKGGEGLDPRGVKVLEALNGTCRREFRITKANLRYINGRLGEGWSVEDLILVIEHKAAQWGEDEKMREYLRPQTLFGPEKFPGYIAAAKEWDAKGRPDPRWRNGGSPRNVVAPEDDLAEFVRRQYGKAKEA